jgi:class 3 adenylate cyclase
VDPDLFERVGLYDPAAPNAADRLQLLSFLVEQDCTLDEMVAADAEGRLFGLAGDRIIRPGRNTLTLSQVADRSAVPLDVVRRTWRAFGLSDPGVDVPVASPADVEMIRTYARIAELVGEETARGVARVFGAAVARIAEAAGSAFGGRVQDIAISRSGSEALTARAFAAAAPLAPELGRVLDTLTRHHLEAARRHLEGADAESRFAVGFADLSGFTVRSASMDPEELSQFMSGMEEVVFDVAADRGARVVKFIGDAVMLVAAAAEPLVDTASALVNHPAVSAVGMTARAGLALGPVVASLGDYFGSPVNLAARLVAVAEPGRLLVDGQVAHSLGPDWRVEPRGARALRGFPDPVPTFEVRRA